MTFYIAAALVCIFGCSSDEMGGAKVPNVLPDTEIITSPPNPLEAGFLIDFEWMGNDSDGEIVGYEWKMSSNGLDGLSIQDTLSNCPITGAILNPWRFTAATDTTFLVTADMDSFPQDVEDLPYDPWDAGDYPEWRSYQTHTFLIRAVDSDGGVDETPAVVHFTSTTLLPTIRIDRPTFPFTGGAHSVPSTIRLGYTGEDPDGDPATPSMVRYLFKSIRLHYEVRINRWYDTSYEEYVSWSDPAWSDWMPYDEDPEERIAEFRDTPAGDPSDDPFYRHYHLFAVQAMDVAGAVSGDRVLDSNVVLLYVSDTLSPTISYRERYLGAGMFTGVDGQRNYEVARTQSVQFTWSASTSHYLGEIAGYRYGWDVVDVTDDGDPGWQGAIGNDLAHRMTQPHVFTPGNHTLTIEAWDTDGQVSRGTVFFDVILVMEPPPNELLLVDDSPDQASNAWVSENGIYTYDQDSWRDQFWQETLDWQNGGPSHFVWADHSMDLETQTIGLSDIVHYQNVIWYANPSALCDLATMFRPGPNGYTVFNWLTPYMQGVGNMMMAGSGIMHLMVEDANWLEPIVFNTAEFRNDAGRRIGFGQYTLPGDDITLFDRGPDQFASDAWGLNFIDIFSPPFPVYDNPSLAGKTARRAAACGVKKLLWDDDFRSNHLFDVPGDFPLGEILTDASIDWRDQEYDYARTLEQYTWGADEFYDENVTSRTVNAAPQMVEIPGTSLEVPAVEPMFIAGCRFEWIKEWAAAEGDTDWPDSEFPDNGDLLDRAGYNALTPGGITVTDGVTVGLVSRKANPLGYGNVLWGFDPYRFDHGDMRKVIQWVLREHFGLD